jgi:hypothetical protein
VFPSKLRPSALPSSEADKLACEAWNKRMLAFGGPAQPSPTIGDVLTSDLDLIGPPEVISGSHLSIGQICSSNFARRHVWCWQRC